MNDDNKDQPDTGYNPSKNQGSTILSQKVIKRNENKLGNLLVKYENLEWKS